MSIFIAIQRFNKDFKGHPGSFISTDAQGDWWGGAGNDFTADVVRAKIHGEWHNMAQVGRRACDNPDLEREQ